MKSQTPKVQIAKDSGAPLARVESLVFEFSLAFGALEFWDFSPS